MRLIALMMFVSFSSQAVWYESTGEAKIRNGNIEQARLMATEDAIQQALLFSGAQVSSLQQVVNGIWQAPTTQIYSHGAINQIEVIDELQSYDTLSISVRIDILDDSETCQNSSLKKNIAITRAGFKFPEQATYGQIFELPKAYSDKLVTHLSQFNHLFNTKSDINRKLNTKSLFTAHHDANTSKLIQQIADQNNSQFVWVSQIDDVSLGEQQNSSLSFWQNKAFERFFTLNSALYNGLTGELITQKHYDTFATWQTKKSARIDVNSEKFWTMPYGQAITDINLKLGQDLASDLACTPAQARILSIDHDTIIISLGSENNLVKGQKLHVALRKGFNQKQLIINTDYQLRVTQVNQNTAIAKVIGDKLLANVQLGDLVTLASF
jgi:hypothetical protein